MMRLGNFRATDWVLTGTAVLLVLLGMAMVLSTTSDKDLVSARLVRQMLAAVLGLGAYTAVSLFPYHRWRRYVPLIFAASVAALFATSQIAPIIRGTASRLQIGGGLQVQPSEFVKISIVCILAWYFAGRPATGKTIVVSGLLTTLAAGLIILEPDLGAAALLVGAWAGLIIYLGVPWRTISILAAIAAIAALAAWQTSLADYQKQRVLTFLNPAADPLGAGYNVTQSLVALGSGGLFGRGLGHGPQSQLNFLPEQHTDFIVASIGEELGFIGIILLLALYSVLLWRIYAIARETGDPFGKYLAVGVYLLLLGGLFINAGMNMGLLPVTGIPLPLVSYGGSSLVSTFILLGIVQSVRMHSTWVRTPPKELEYVA
ncbi:MAG: rod shape-determining protein RodA [Candidatus Andersenbacteria bacterium CG10_big_fil_rev_8_21_14_0_10_54_11]|uniref:Rod shape-determining protein RodA n=1 Tax=Candidatus Andersenbacteria bacterium CG10_big_fil_rev_8_21_14_0_10_54_11 TaxID=1974485 RepID=A0A2M6WZU7_9BACT|nr:MAG: rod shape-determining protein RodA [Candidatus Andersenbacteria bacterium CG10_big_fil_rev_8_21_14_0_10_54_11]